MIPTSLTISAAVHRIGGDPHYPDRDWGHIDWTHTIATAGEHVLGLDSLRTASRFIHLRFADWVQVREDWLGVNIELLDMNGYRLGRRPALIYDQPYDVPTFTQIDHPEAGLFSVALRRPIRFRPDQKRPTA